MRLVALDPGGVTGWASKREDEQWLFQQIGPEEHHDLLYRMLTSHLPTVVVCEHFEWRPNRHQNAEYGDRYVELISREYEGVVKLWGSIFNMPVVIQTAGHAKGFVKDENIKKLGLWQPGQKHAMDALRHALRYITDPKNDHPDRMKYLQKGWK